MADLKDLWLVVGLILSIFAWWQLVLLRRWVLSPLERLAAIAQSAGQQGDYSARMPAHDRDEFGQLANASMPCSPQWNSGKPV